MPETIELDGVAVPVIRKRIRYLRLSVRSPDGAVRISAPLRMSLVTIRGFALSKLGWIRRHQERLRLQRLEEPGESLELESLPVWGERCRLRVVEREATPAVLRESGSIVLQVRPGTGIPARQALVTAWQREQVEQAVPRLIATWEARLGVTVSRFSVRRMTSRWGSCTPRARSIRVNSELARKPPACLEYIVVHEMVHLLEPSHNRRFQELMDRFMPAWRQLRGELNRVAVRKTPGSLEFADG
jgi:predicted metal-dependent hydrolase